MRIEIVTTKCKRCGKQIASMSQPVYSSQATMNKSGAFDYGNGTGMSMQFKGSMEECFDTRYEQVSADNFKEYAEEFLKNYLADGLKAEPI